MTRFHEQYLGERAERALEQLREEFSGDRIDLDTFERLTGEILAGHPVDLPFYVPRLLAGVEVRR